MKKTGVTSSNHKEIFSAIYLALLTIGSINEAKADIPALTISTAVQQAMDKNPDVLKAREAVTQSGYDSSAALSRVLPTISASAQGFHQKDASLLNYPNFGGESYNQYKLSLNLVQPLFDGGAMFAALRYGKKNKEIKNYSLEIAERATTQTMMETFYTLLLNERLLQILNDTYQVNQSVLKTAEQHFRVGRIQKVDLLQLKTQTALLKPKIESAQNQMQINASKIATLLHDLNSTHIHTQGKLVVPDPSWVKSMSANKKTSLPEIQQSKTMVDQFEDSRTIQMAGYWPSLNFVGQIGRTAYSKTDLLDGNATNWTIGLELNIPIFNGLASIYQRNSLASQEKQMELDETKVTDTVSVSQIQTEKDLLVAESQLAAATEAAGWGRDVLKEAEKDFRYSTISYLQYQNSLQTYLDAESGFFQAKYNFIIASSKYFSAMGIPLSLLVNKLEELSTQTKSDL